MQLRYDLVIGVRPEQTLRQKNILASLFQEQIKARYSSGFTFLCFDLKVHLINQFWCLDLLTQNAEGQIIVSYLTSLQTNTLESVGWFLSLQILGKFAVLFETSNDVGLRDSKSSRLVLRLATT